MTQKEKENALCALSNIQGCISELEYYKKSGWLNDTGALELAKSCKGFLDKLMKRK